jgi:hypothetical protein
MSRFKDYYNNVTTTIATVSVLGPYSQNFIFFVT